MTRRNFVSTAAMASLAGSALADSRTNFDGTPPKSAMGIATTSFGRSAGNGRDTLQFLEKCHALGAGGIQSALTSTDPAYIRNLRVRAEQFGMYIETMIPFPKASDQSAFEAAVKASKEAGAVAIRVGSDGGRRYEKWNSLADWTAFLKESGTIAQSMSQVAEKAKIPIGLENHKDFTVEEMLSGMKHMASDYFGVTLDFGNNIALLDAPEDILELAPYAKLTHVKDMAVEPYADGFRLSEVVLGEGILDVKKMVAAVRERQPKTRFTLEMMTREPLDVPCLTDKYWVTFPQRNGRYLARTLRMVSEVSARKETARLQPLPRYKQFDAATQVRVEEENVKICLHYGREQLGL